MLNFIDLFAGAGGASLGLENAGFNAIAAVEIDQWAADTYRYNCKKTTKVFQQDITQLKDSFFKKMNGIDLIIGGPPCQGFSIAASNRRNPKDSRNNLYKEFIRAVKFVEPEFFIVENVKEILKFKLKNGELLIDNFSSSLKKLGYNVSYGLLNASDFGVPQNRIRFFMLGSKSHDLNINHLQIKLGEKLTVLDAISDLPVPKVKVDSIPFIKKAANGYQRKLRNGAKIATNHEPMNHTSRVIERFKLIPINGNIENVPIEHRNRKRGDVTVLSNSSYSQNHRRLDPNKPCKTITASFYSSFIHPYQHRNLTAREAARIQGFPDNFVFKGKRTTLSKKLLEKKGIFEDMHLDQFNQIGNAVSPIIAEILGNYLKSLIKI